MRRSTGDGPAARRPPGMLEDEVLAALWSGGRPMTPADVRLDLDDRPPAAAVVSTLTRLHRKGLVVREPTGEGYAYTPAIDEAAQAMSDLLPRRRDRAGVLTHGDEPRRSTGMR